MLSDPTVAAFEKYDVLSRRELESRFEVWTEQYVTRANIEAETTQAMARTSILPAALRHLALIAESGLSATFDTLEADVRSMTEDLIAAIGELEAANIYPDGVEGLDLAVYARDNQLTAMAKVREVADLSLIHI